MAHVLLLSSLLAWLAFASALGIHLPSHVSLGGSANADLLAGVSAGVLLSVALLHLLNDAQERLEPLTEYPAANAVALLGYLIMATTQALMPCLHGQSNRMLLTPLVDGAQPDSDLVRARFYALEASISLHSVLIGLGMGFAHSGWTELLVLALALTVHQFFEGFALGMFARRAHLSPLGWYVTCVVFALSLPLGGVLAMSVQLLFLDFASSTTYLWVSGLLNAFAAGFLMQIGVEMVNHELTGGHQHSCSEISPHKHPQQQHGTSPRRLALKVSSVVAGAALFAFLAIWA